LHLIGNGSSMTITHTLAYGNMGQQIKVGGASGTATNNIIFTNCNAMRQAIPGTPSGYNKRLSDFCRAADSGIVFTVSDNSTAVFSDNIIYSASATAIEVDVGQTCETATCLVRQQRNIFIGFRNNAANGYPNGGSGDYSNPLFVDTPATRAYRNPGSTFDHNTTFNAKSGWPCPATRLHEMDAYCGDPHLADESWHLYGYGDTKATQSSPKTSGSTKSQKRSTGAIWASVGVAVITTGCVTTWLKVRSARLT
jgi:hypothetical protein